MIFVMLQDPCFGGDLFRFRKNIYIYSVWDNYIYRGEV